ncbi:MAG: hypothetical protein CL874_00655 [Dehalococcoidales bacterium]|nr:hypothetical protein [Dehalococcoidales bacterium]
MAILKPFDGLQEIQNKLGIAQVDFKDVADKAKGRMSHLLLSRRFNFAAPGTKALAFFCDEFDDEGHAQGTEDSDGIDGSRRSPHNHRDYGDDGQEQTSVDQQSGYAPLISAAFSFRLLLFHTYFSITVVINTTAFREAGQAAAKTGSNKS